MRRVDTGLSANRSRTVRDRSSFVSCERKLDSSERYARVRYANWSPCEHGLSYWTKICKQKCTVGPGPITNDQSPVRDRRILAIFVDNNSIIAIIIYNIIT